MRFPLSAALVLFSLLPAADPAAAQSAPDLDLPKLNLQQYAPADEAVPDLRRETGRLQLEAKLTDKGEPVQAGIVWRVFEADPGPDGRLRLIAKAEGGPASLDVPEGTYLVHAAFGRAGATKKIVVGTERVEEVLVLDAGALAMRAEESSGNAIPPFKLRFAVYEAEVDEAGERRLIVDNVAPGAIVRLSEGNYHIVSSYGAVNAIMRTDIRVEPGVVTEATVQHRAAELILKLVARPGGEALADTSWSVYTESGELLFQSIGAYAPVVLAEGGYTAVAKHRDRVFEKPIMVESGKNGEVEVLAEF
ncbi:MAG: hypothetical protein MUC58_00075 [Rhizobiaceae bacterium]|jgi:hypothetical protein|nr:hypothetical protein [Rhizobiaceae bacterium]